MDRVFLEQQRVAAAVAADYYLYNYRYLDMQAPSTREVVDQAREAVTSGSLLKCLICDAVLDVRCPPSHLLPGGELYELGLKTHGVLVRGKQYYFPKSGLVCTYDPTRDCLVNQPSLSRTPTCTFCEGTKLRKIDEKNQVQYQNGDKTKEPCHNKDTKCLCGFKHYWDGHLYDGIPAVFPLTLEWAGEQVDVEVAWFENQSDASLNSNVYDIAQKLVNQHFPGEFGSERLVQRIVDILLQRAARVARTAQAGAACSPPPNPGASQEVEMKDDEKKEAWNKEEASKIILTGFKRKTIHKEELTASQAEKTVRENISRHVEKDQRQASDRAAAKTQTPASVPVSKASTQQSAGKTPSDVGASPVTSSVRPSTPSDQIRVTISDGRQVVMSLKDIGSVGELQKRLAGEVGVPEDKQSIRYGFPPRPLDTNGEDNKSKAIPFKPGDRISLHILQQSSRSPSPARRNRSSPPMWNTTSPSRSRSGSGGRSSLGKGDWSTFDPNTTQQTAETFLQGLHDIDQSGPMSALERSIQALQLLASLSGRSLWDYVQTTPHLFSVGGLFYQLLEQQFGSLSDRKHYRIDHLPGKLFRYSSAEDRLELCLEPHGHFPVEPGVEQRVEDEAFLHNVRMLRNGASSSPPCGGGSAFPGQGQALRESNIRRPTDLPSPPHSSSRHSVGLKQRADSIQEEDEEEETVPISVPSAGAGLEAGTSVRLGPGYSVVLDNSRVPHTSPRHSAGAMGPGGLEGLMEEEELQAMDTSESVSPTKDSSQEPR